MRRPMPDAAGRARTASSRRVHTSEAFPALVVTLGHERSSASGSSDSLTRLRRPRLAERWRERVHAPGGTVRSPFEASACLAIIASGRHLASASNEPVTGIRSLVALLSRALQGHDRLVARRCCADCRELAWATVRAASPGGASAVDFAVAGTRIRDDRETRGRSHRPPEEPPARAIEGNGWHRTPENLLLASRGQVRKPSGVRTVARHAEGQIRRSVGPPDWPPLPKRDLGGVHLCSRARKCVDIGSPRICDRAARIHQRVHQRLPSVFGEIWTGATPKAPAHNDVASIRRDRCRAHQKRLPGSPLNGPQNADVIQPP